MILPVMTVTGARVRTRPAGTWVGDRASLTAQLITYQGPLETIRGGAHLRLVVPSWFQVAEAVSKASA